MVEELRQQQQQSCRGTGREVKVVQPLQAVKLCSSLLPPSSYSGYVTPELALKQLRAAYVQGVTQNSLKKKKANFHLNFTQPNFT